MKSARDDTQAPEAVNTEQQEAGQAQDVAQDALERLQQKGQRVLDQEQADSQKPDGSPTD